MTAEQSDAALQRGLALHQQGRLEEARTAYEQALRLQPENATALNLLGGIAVATNDPTTALDFFARAIRLDPQNVLLHLNEGYAHSMLGRHAAAIGCYDRAIATASGSNVSSTRDYLAEAHYRRGNVLALLGQWEAALASYESAVAARPGFAEALANRGLALAELQLWEAALTSYDSAIAIKPDHAAALSNRGNALRKLERREAALASYDRAIAVSPNFADAWANRGLVLVELKQWEAALTSYDRAIAIRPDHATALSNRGNVLRQLRRWEAALASYDRAIAIRPDHAEALFNRGNVLAELARWEAALASYDRAIAIRPDDAETLFNRGNALADLRRWEAAVASYDLAVAVKPDHARALANRGNALGELKQWKPALASYARAIEADPAIPFVRGHRFDLRLHLCDWDGLDEELARLTTAIERGEAAAEPFEVLAASGSARVQRLAAESYVRERCGVETTLPPIRKRTRRDRLRVGYFSADFRNHPVSYLTAELFEEHDRSRLEVIGLSFGPEGLDEMRLRLEKAFDRFIDVRGRSDVEIALLAREMELDIAIDLGGYTHNSRAGIFAHRAAPLQVGYIGYLGTMAAPFMDYLVADRTIVPATSRAYYAEKLIYLPSYQVNDSKRRIADKVFTREELGLPQTGFVFCCLNAAYKIVPAVFTIWMRVLEAVPGSVLVLLSDDPAAQGNLRREAERRGVAAARLLFCSRLPRDEYLARFRAMDLFLDTLPYNAGTTASDALWAGLPVLTCTGEAFASRVCASLLTAMEIEELITSTPDHYEQLAIALATTPERIARLREELAGKRLTTPLFDTRSFTRRLEAAYFTIYDRYISDLPPDDVEIQSAPHVR